MLDYSLDHPGWVAHTHAVNALTQSLHDIIDSNIRWSTSKNFFFSLYCLHNKLANSRSLASAWRAMKKMHCLLQAMRHCFILFLIELLVLIVQLSGEAGSSGRVWLEKNGK